MDGERFDTLARVLALGISRRNAMARLVVLTGISLASLDEAEAKKKRRKNKKKQPTPTVVGSSPSPPPPSPPRCPQPANPHFCAATDTCRPACSMEKRFDAATCTCICPTQTCCSCQIDASTKRCFSDLADVDACATACANANGTRAIFSGFNGFSSACSLNADEDCTTTCSPD